MQWETATPVGLPACTRHKDCRLKYQTAYEASSAVLTPHRVHCTLRTRHFERHARNNVLHMTHSRHCALRTSCHALATSQTGTPRTLRRAYGAVRTADFGCALHALQRTHSPHCVLYTVPGEEGTRTMKQLPRARSCRSGGLPSLVRRPRSALATVFLQRCRTPFVVLRCVPPSAFPWGRFCASPHS